MEKRTSLRKEVVNYTDAKLTLEDFFSTKGNKNV